MTDVIHTVKVTSPFSLFAAIVHYSFSSVNEKRPALLFLDPTDFISDDATSNLSYSSQTNTFCQSQNRAVTLTKTPNKGLTQKC